MRHTRSHRTRKTIKGSVSKRSRYGWAWLLVVVALSVLYLAPRSHELSRAFQTAAQANALPLLGAVIATSWSYIFSTLVVLGSSIQRLPFSRTLLVQLAAAVMNRITPKGLGGAAVIEQYFEYSGMKRSRALAALTYIYASGLLVHSALLLMFILARGDDISLVTTRRWDWIIWLLPLAGIAVIGLLKHTVRRAAARSIDSLKRGWIERVTNPLALLLLLGGSLGVSLSYAAALYFSLMAFGAQVTPIEVVFIYLVATAIGTAAPTPAGLGAADAAAVAGLVAMDVPIDVALAGMITFRLVSFWLPILPGLAALRKVSRWNFLKR